MSEKVVLTIVQKESLKYENKNIINKIIIKPQSKTKISVLSYDYEFTLFSPCPNNNKN